MIALSECLCVCYSSDITIRFQLAIITPWLDLSLRWPDCFFSFCVGVGGKKVTLFGYSEFLWKGKQTFFFPYPKTKGKKAVWPCDTSWTSLSTVLSLHSTKCIHKLQCHLAVAVQNITSEKIAAIRDHHW